MLTIPGLYVLVPPEEIEDEVTRHRGDDICGSDRDSTTGAGQFTSARSSRRQVAVAGDSGQANRDT